MWRAGFALFCTFSLHAAGVDYARDIQPLLQKHCLMCHGSQQQMSGLRLDSREAALKGGASGVDVVPGNSAGSRLMRLVSGVDKKVMPPAGQRLTEAEIALLRAWIDEGLTWPAQSQPHWAFRKIAPPDAKGIDEFILARLKSEGI